MSPERVDRVHVLLVEDNPADADLIRETMSSGRLDLTFEVAGDGEKASDILHRRGTYLNVRLPDLVILDLNLPRRSGWELLREMRGDAVLRKVPVVVLTSSESDRDVGQSYSEGANCFISKPLDFTGFREIVHSVETFWFSVARLPTVDPPPHG